MGGDELSYCIADLISIQEMTLSTGAAQDAAEASCILNTTLQIKIFGSGDQKRFISNIIRAQFTYSSVSS